MQEFLKNVFGSQIVVSEYTYSENVPVYIKHGYYPHKVVWNENICILLSPVDSSWRLPTIKKQLKKFQELCEYPCALSLEGLTALQRRNLLENNIPFVSDFQQVYLPFWGCLFFERFKAEASFGEKMAPGTQMVFLYLYYLQNAVKVNMTQIANDLNISKATCNRAINDLIVSGLILQEAEGRIKWISLTFEKEEFLKKGYARLQSPVERCIYVKTPISIKDQVKSGLLALTDISMVGAKENDGASAIYKKLSSEISVNDIISQRDFEDFGGYVVEVWRYDPTLFAEDGRVDDISLLLSLEGDSNERVQMGLDEIREKHGLPIEDND